MSDDAKERFFGVMLCCHFNDEMTKGHGFLRPEAETAPRSDRSRNVWVGAFAAAGAVPIKVGDRVSYILKLDRRGRNTGRMIADKVRQAPPKNPVLSKEEAWAAYERDRITRIPGEFDT